MPIQKCPMCLETKNVVSSHLYPAALYDYCRSTDGSSPMRVANDAVMVTDWQVQDYLLCLGCEDILNKGGETWVNPKLATIKDGFPLYDLLVKVAPVFQDEKGGVYWGSQNPDIHVEKLNKSPGTCSEKLCHRFVDCLVGPVRTTSVFSGLAMASVRFTFFGNALSPRSHRRIGSAYGPRSILIFSFPIRHVCTAPFQNIPIAKCVDFDLDQPRDEAENAIGYLLQTPEAYLAAHGIAWNLRPSSENETPVNFPQPGLRAPEALLSVDPYYSDESGKAHVQGTVTIKCVIGTDGLIHAPVIEKGLTKELNQLALEAMTFWRFRPVSDGSRAVAAKVSVEIGFKLL